MPKLNSNAQSLLRDPLVLTAALDRVRSWNESGEVIDRIDITQFEAAGGEALLALGEELANGSYAPKPFPLVPYPKKDARLRHYCCPSMRDQVAFAVFGVLLAPFVEAGAPRFVFGNRWYRKLRRSHALAQWSLRPFNISDSRMYMPYRLDYGLFRRVCHWTERAMVQGSARDLSDDGSWTLPQLGPMDLPPCCDKDFWAPADAGYWGRLDLKLAYPSVSLEELRKNLTTLASQPVDVAGLDYPQWITNRMRPTTMRQIARYLCDLLDSLRFDVTHVGTQWIPDDSDQQLPSDRPTGYGLPTGLALSGLLLNAALYRADQLILSAQTASANSWAFLRFADDMVLFSQTPEGLCETVELVAKALDTSALPLKLSKSNWRFNTDKTLPTSLREMLAEYRAEANELAFYDWAVITRGSGNKLSESRIERNGHKHFSTYMIERLSELGTESLETEFGDAAGKRARELDALATEAFEDRIIRDDTRVSFAINRLTQTSVSPANEHRELAAIRESVSIALRRVPWKFGLWRSAVRLACRSHGAPTTGNQSDGLVWLEQLLHSLAIGRPDTQNWITNWPERGVQADPENVNLIVSFLRTAVWRAFGETLRDLAAQVRANSHWGWARRVLYDRDLSEVWLGLAETSRWLGCIYPLSHNPAVEVFWWEADALTEYLLATAGERPLRNMRILEGGWAPSQIWRALAPQALRGVGTATNERSQQKRVNFWDALSLRAALNDDMAKGLAVEAAEAGPKADPSALSRMLASGQFLTEVPAAWDRSPWLAHRHELHRRRMGLSRVAPGAEPTIHRLLWGDWTEGSDLLQWSIQPAHAPVLALPAAVCQRLLAEGLDAALANRARAIKYPVWSITEEGANVLSKLRRAQLGDVTFEDTPCTDPLVRLTENWEVPVHPAFRLLELSGKAPPAIVSRLWCNALLFLTAAVGSERFLDAMVGRWSFGLNMPEDWEVRRSIPLSRDKWDSLSALLKACLAFDQVEAKVRALELRLHDRTKPLSTLVRIDIWLTADDDSPELVWLADIFPNLQHEIDTDSLTVRLAQISEHPNWPSWRAAYANTPTPTLSASDARRIMVEVTAALSAPSNIQAPNTVLGPVILPEVTIPPQYVGRLESHVRATGRAILGGQIFQTLPLVAPNAVQKIPPRRFLVNEAVFLCPLYSKSDAAVATVRQFRITKPIPTHAEYALAEDLRGVHAREWRVLRGNYWYRFVHPQWGDFSVAICSDLLDPKPWSLMSGHLLHLFMCAYNTDVELYDSLTWIRAYENYVNVAATNHGEHGGSFAWTPKGAHKRELARLRGNGLFLVADVRLPVLELFREQHFGVQQAVDRERRKTWQKSQSETSKETYKAPPPGYIVGSRRGFQPPKP